MKSIMNSVGYGGLNRPEDVKAVQHLLNLNIEKMGFSKLLVEDGKFGPKTLAMIQYYKENVLREFRPSLVIEPHSRVMVSLNLAITNPVLFPKLSYYNFLCKVQNYFMPSKKVHIPDSLPWGKQKEVLDDEDILKRINQRIYQKYGGQNDCSHFVCFVMDLPYRDTKTMISELAHTAYDKNRWLIGAFGPYKGDSGTVYHCGVTKDGIWCNVEPESANRSNTWPRKQLLEKYKAHMMKKYGVPIIFLEPLVYRCM